MIDSITQDAREYGQHVKAGGWRLGLLVARNVARGAGQGARKPPAADSGKSKVGIEAFAKAAGVGKDRIRKHLDAWERAAVDGHVPPACDLAPGDEVSLDAEQLPAWSEYYEPVSGGYNGGNDRVPTKALVEQQLDKLSAKDRASLATQLVAQDEVREAILVSGPLAIEQHLELTEDVVTAVKEESERRFKTKFPSHAARSAADEIEQAIRHLSNAREEMVRWSVTATDDRLRLASNAMTRVEELVKEINEILSVGV